MINKFTTPKPVVREPEPAPNYKFGGAVRKRKHQRLCAKHLRLADKGKFAVLSKACDVCAKST